MTSDEIMAIIAQWEAILPIFECMLRRVLPHSVHSKMSKETLVRLFPLYMEQGFLDGMLAHYTQVNEDLLASPTVRAVVTLTPLQPGDELTGDLLALARRQLNSSTHATGSAAHATLRPKLPEPDTYEGPKAGKPKVVALRHLCQWIDTCQTNAALSGMPEPQQVAWAASFLKGPAANWWATFRLSQELHSFAVLKDGLVHRFVGQNAFEIICADLEGKTLGNFPRYDNFKAWFVQTVAAMKAFAPPQRMWTDTVLIDKLLLCLQDTLYYEGVAVDPSQGCALPPTPRPWNCLTSTTLSS
jgi:hypothetical protein